LAERHHRDDRHDHERKIAANMVGTSTVSLTGLNCVPNWCFGAVRFCE